MQLFRGSAVAEEQESYFLHFQEMQGGVVNNPKIAIDIAELVIANVYGDNEVKLQRPFEVFWIKAPLSLGVKVMVLE